MAIQLLNIVSDVFLADVKLILLVLSFSAFLIFCIRRIYFSTLSHIPGPPITALSRHYITLLQHLNLRSITLRRWHSYYGPVVRSSPVEVSIISPEGIRAVYSDPAYFKDPTFYGRFYNFSEPSSFTASQAEDHGWRRRLLADRYTLSYIIKEEGRTGAILQVILKYLGIIQDSVSIQAPEALAPYKIDIFMLNAFFAVDVITERLFGPTLSTNCLAGNEKGKRIVREEYRDSRRRHWYLLEEFPWLGELVLSWTGYATRRIRRNSVLGEDGVPIKMFVDTQAVEDYCWNSYQELKGGVNPGGTLAEKLACMVDNKALSKGDKSLTDISAVSELINQYFAGMTTTSDTLSFLMHQISLPASQHFQQKLRAELLSPSSPAAEFLSCSPGDSRKTFSVGALTKLLELPYLDALLKETFRLYPPVPLTLPRVVPSSNDTQKNGRHIDGHFIPAGTIIGTFAYGLHRDADVFTSVDEFCPDRWLVGGASEEERDLERGRIKVMEKRLWVFTSGGRACVGRHLAMLEMKLFLAMVYSRYTTIVDRNERTRLQHDFWNNSDTLSDVLPFPDVKGPLTFIPNL